MKAALFLLPLFLASHAHAFQKPYTSAQIRDFGDILFRDPDRPEELNDPALTAVTREFGPARIPMGSLPFESEQAVADITPWSSWWFPKIDRDLFDDGMGTSPLEKYDLVRTAFSGRPSKSAAVEAKDYDPNRPRWEGLCDAWAIASTIFPEPKAPRTVKLPNGTVVSFSVGDQKALLLKTVDSVPAEALKSYGQRFLGNMEGWIFPDIFPQELHRFVEKRLFEQRKIFIMDHDPGVEVWSEPVYKANYKISPVLGRTDAVFVRLWLYSATSFADKSQRDRAGIREIAREYDYYLYGKQDGAGNLVVDSGVWAKGDLVDSRRDHPDFVYYVADPAMARRVGQNPEVDPQTVEKILGK